MDYKAVYRDWLEKTEGEEKAELLAIGGDDNEIKARFSADLAFGTAGMRGEIALGTARMNVYTVRKATEGLARYVAGEGADSREKGVVISYDTRRFSRSFALAAAEVLSAFKIKVYIFEDVRPVPVCSFAVRYYGAVAGIMITASHNPKEYNGYKVYGADGAQMSPEATDIVVCYIDRVKDCFAVPRTEIDYESFVRGSEYRLNDFITVIGSSLDEKYFAELDKLLLSPDIIKKRGGSVKLVYTPVHGSGHMPVTSMFRRLGINAYTVEEQCAPDGEFSTVSVPNPENAETLSMGIALGNRIGADVVLGTDPDCDRLGAAVRNDEGQFVLLTGNQIGVLLLDYILTRRKERGILPGNGAVVKTIVTTTLADRLCAARGATVFNVLTGFKFIGEKIKEWEENGKYQYLFGFEESYGSLCGTHARDKDAVIASLLFTEMLMYLEDKGSGVYKRLQELYREYGYYAEVNSSAVFKGLSGMEDMAAIMRSLREKKIFRLGGEEVIALTDYLAGKTYYPYGREEGSGLPKSDVVYFSLSDGQFVCVRPSGTEPKLKIYVLVFAESADASRIKANDLMSATKALLSK